VAMHVSIGRRMFPYGTDIDLGHEPLKEVCPWW
jgi:hypothetical protein